MSDYNIPYHERQHGQLFCDESSKDILDMLLSECAHAGVNIQLNCSIKQIHKDHTTYHLDTTLGHYAAHSLVIATGGLSIPKMGATGFGYQIAKQFGHTVQPTRAGLVPFTLQEKEKTWLSDLSGIAIHCLVSNQRNRFKENMLLTHRGLSGPAILQISSYWRAGETITINLIPDIDLQTLFKEKQEAQPKTQLKALLADFLPKRFISALLGNAVVLQPLQSISFERFKVIAKQLQQWQIKPNNTEGYRTAEVTLGGVDCNELSSQTMESKHSSGLYFIGEVVDVTGWLGGYNFQWAWSSGWCAGQVV